MSTASTTQTVPSTLIITLFANPRPPSPRPSPRSQSAQDLSIPLSSTQPASSDITTLLQSIHPEYQTNPPTLTQTHHHTPHITQLTYLLPTSTPPPKFSNLRHHAQVTTYESSHNVETIFDAFPTPLQSAPAPSSSERPIRLALFDMDSTLINEEVIDELARTIGVSDAVSAITARAMNGEIDFETSLRERVGMLKGVEEGVWEELKTGGKVTVAEGARELVAGLKRRGVVTAVVSGGFMPMAEWLKGELGLDYAVANHLSTTPSPHPTLTGTLSPTHPIITPEHKRLTLHALAEKHHIPLSETLAVGDGSNDLLMLHAAGLGVAWNAKARVQLAAPARLNGGSLGELLWLLGGE